MNFMQQNRKMGLNLNPQSKLYVSLMMVCCADGSFLHSSG